MERIELSISGCKPDVFPLALHPHNTVAPEAGHDPATFGLTDRRYYQLSYSGTENLERVGRVELRDLQLGRLLDAPCPVYPQLLLLGAP